jgi:hypothetical protein
LPVVVKIWLVRVEEKRERVAVNDTVSVASGAKKTIFPAVPASVRLN